MAVLAVAGGGALLGSTVGLTSVGWLAGSIIGNLLFGPKQKSTVTEGPRLGDLTVQSSAYGGAIPYGYGTIRMAGNIIWSPGLIEHKNTDRQTIGGKGGKKATATAVTYTYSCSFACAFGQGEAEAVLRIWADSKLIYDVGAGTNPKTKMDGLVFRFYPGSETQLPDGLIEADKGIGNVPAFRGLCYIVFDNLELENFGNRIPNITVELVYRQITQQQPTLIWTPIDHPVAARITNSSGTGVDFKRQVVYTVKITGAADTWAIRRMQYNSLVEDRVVLSGDMGIEDDNFSFTNLYCGTDGFLYCSGAGGNSRNILKIDPNSFQVVGKFGTLTSVGPGSTSLINSTTHFVTTDFFGMLSAYGPAGKIDFLICGGIFNTVGIINAGDMTYVWGQAQTVDEANVIGVINGDVFDGSGTAYVIGGGRTGSGSPNIGIYKASLDAVALFDPLSGLSAGIEFEKIDTIAASTIKAGATAFTAGVAIGRDPSDGGLIIFTAFQAGGGDPHLFKYIEGTGIEWNTEVPDGYNALTTGVPTNTKLDGTTYSWVTSNSVRTIDLRDGTYSNDPSWAGLSAGWPQIYDADSNTILFRNGSDGGPSGSVYWRKIFLGRAAPSGEVLGTIVSDLCSKVNLGPSDIDVSELTDIVPGFVIGQPSTIRAALDPLTQAFFFDGVESDFIMKFPKRGGDSVATIPQRDLAQLNGDNGDVLRETRTQEVELPVRINVLYMDSENDYQQGTQSDKRVAAPIPTMLSKNITNLQLPLVLDTETAKRIAQKWLFTSWIERVSYEIQVSWAWLELDPSDIIQILLDSGDSFQGRIIRNDIGTDMNIAFNLLAQEPATYSSTVAASAGDGVPQQIIPGTAHTKLFLLDIPLLLDANDTRGIASRVYYAMGGFGPEGWPGALLYKSADNVSYIEAGQSNNEVAYGTCANALPPPPVDAFVPDTVNTLKVFMTTGADRLSSVTTLEVYNSANPALILSADGTPEIIQFRDVTLNDDGSYTLSWLLRGRRGTDVFTDDHVIGETFILIEQSTFESVLLSLDELNMTRYYKAVGFNTLLIEADLETRSNTGRDLKPWAPVHAAAALVASDINITWERRTRINGGWMDGTGIVPLGEESESYEVDILSGPSGTLKRTLIASTPSVTYTSANITTDFGSPPSTLTMRIYQISAAVGRGFTREVTVNVS